MSMLFVDNPRLFVEQQGTVFVDGLKENVATSVDDVMSEMKKAEGLSFVNVESLLLENYKS